MKNKNNKESNYNIKMTAIICMTLITVVGLIGLFWGADEFRYMGIGILLFSVGMMLIISEQ